MVENPGESRYRVENELRIGCGNTGLWNLEKRTNQSRRLRRPMSRLDDNQEVDHGGKGKGALQEGSNEWLQLN